MITVKELARIRRWYHRDGLSISEIARRCGWSRNTVKRWLRESEDFEPKYRRVRAPGKIEPFAAQLIKALETDARRPKRDRRTALKLYAELKAAGAAISRAKPSLNPADLKMLRELYAKVEGVIKRSAA